MLARGIRKGLTRYGDQEFALFLRKVFKAMGYSGSQHRRSAAASSF